MPQKVKTHEVYELGKEIMALVRTEGIGVLQRPKVREALALSGSNNWCVANYIAEKQSYGNPVLERIHMAFAMDIEILRMGRQFPVVEILALRGSAQVHRAIANSDEAMTIPLNDGIYSSVPSIIFAKTTDPGGKGDSFRLPIPAEDKADKSVQPLGDNRDSR